MISSRVIMVPILYLIVVIFFLVGLHVSADAHPFDQVSGKISDSKPEATGPSPEERVEFLQGYIALFSYNQWTGVIDWCHKWLQRYPNDKDLACTAWYLLGTAYYKLYRYKEAIEAFRQSLRIDPDNINAAESLESIATIYVIIGNKTAAHEPLQQLQRIDSERAARFNQWLEYR